MEKNDFYKLLEDNKATDSEKLEVCNYFLANYPVNIDEVIKRGPIQFKTGRKTWTMLKDIASEEDFSKNNIMLIDHAFNQLVKRIKELKQFDDERMD